MIRLWICIYLLFIVSPSYAQSKPTMAVADIRSSAAAVFHYIGWLSERSSHAPYLPKNGDEKLFVSAHDAKDKDITAAASIKYLRSSGYNAYAAWRSGKLAPEGGRGLFLTNPIVKGRDSIKWTIVSGHTGEKGSENVGSVVGHSVIMKKEKKGWKCVGEEDGFSAG